MKSFEPNWEVLQISCTPKNDLVVLLLMDTKLEEISNDTVDNDKVNLAMDLGKSVLN